MYTLETANPLISFPSPMIRVELQRPELCILTATKMKDFDREIPSINHQNRRIR